MRKGSRSTHCRRGHELTPDNVHVHVGSGSRQCKQCVKDTRARWQQTDSYKHFIRKSNLKRSFDMSVEEYDSLLQKQDGKCGICKTGADPSGRRFAVDHDHVTGKVRGLLCMNCNNGLGRFRDSPELLTAAIAYLQNLTDSH